MNKKFYYYSTVSKNDYGEPLFFGYATDRHPFLSLQALQKKDKLITLIAFDEITEEEYKLFHEINE